MIVMQEKCEIIQMMITYEETLNRLYRDFSKSFPEQKDFWFKLSVEEDAHATWVKTLYEKLKQGEVEFADDRIPGDEIKKALDRFEELTTRMKKEDITLLEALELAGEVENSMLEARFFEFFEGDSDEIHETFERLGSQTREHLDRINTVLNNTKEPLTGKEA